jgi:hypothetical protein
MKTYYTIYNKENKSIAIFENINGALLFRCANRKECKKNIQISYLSKIPNQWYEIREDVWKNRKSPKSREEATKILKEKGDLIGYVSDLKYMSFLTGPFNSTIKD